MYRFLIFFVVLLYPVVLDAYRMPEYAIAQADWDKPAEEVFAQLSEERDAIGSIVSVDQLDNYRRCHSCKLSRREARAYQRYLKLKISYEFWKYVTDLKRDLVGIAGECAKGEADLMAKKIIQKLYDLSNEYRVAGSALINNLLVNMKVKDKGYCYQYTDALRKTLKENSWRFFDLYWGAAYDKTWLENNGLVITAKGQPFETGIVVDPWRTASRPYWNFVKGDRYPWKELKDVQIEEQKR
jgi:hypothetical protein